MKRRETTWESMIHMSETTDNGELHYRIHLSDSTTLYIADSGTKLINLIICSRSNLQIWDWKR